MTKHVLTLEANKTGRDFVIGDLHGALSPLLNLLDRVKFDPQVDRLISVGDLVDRGPNNVECLKLLLEPWFFAVRGNHEQLFTLADSNPLMYDIWKRNGGGWAISKEDHAFFREKCSELPSVINVRLRDDTYAHIIHAELPPGVTVRTADLLDEDFVRDTLLNEFDHYGFEMLYWCRVRFRHLSAGASNLQPFDKVRRVVKYDVDTNVYTHNPELTCVISGHTIVQHPITVLGQTNIDTGAFMSLRDGRSWTALTVVELNSWSFYQATETEFRTVQPLVVNMENLNNE